jgi:hypothetical protein
VNEALESLEGRLTNVNGGKVDECKWREGEGVDGVLREERRKEVTRFYRRRELLRVFRYIWQGLLKIWSRVFCIQDIMVRASIFSACLTDVCRR